MSSAPFELEERYRLDALIAEGGMGEVWRATDLLLAREVAVKLLRPGAAQDELGLTRFRAEAQYAGSLSHPNIARVYDYGAGEPAARPYLVMELVDGPSLAALLAAGPLPPERTLEIISQAAAGLHAAHAAGLVHRDIKPGNLLLTKSGQVKIADFGIAYAVGSAPVTRTGEVIGTPAYLSPEQAAGRSATPASDLYAVGMVAYECLAGKPPYTGEPLAVALAHQEEELPPLPGSVPPPVAALVSHLAAKDPAARPATAWDVSQMATRLQAALRGDPVTLPGIPVPRSAAESARQAHAPGPVPSGRPAAATGGPLATAAPAAGLALPRDVAPVVAAAAPAALAVPGGPAAPGGPASPAAPGEAAGPAESSGAPGSMAAFTGFPAATAAALPLGPAPQLDTGLRLDTELRQDTGLRQDPALAPAAPVPLGAPIPLAGAPGLARPPFWRRRYARGAMAAAGIAVFGFTGLAMSGLPGAPAGHQRLSAPPSSHPSAPATSPGRISGAAPSPQAVATHETGSPRPRHAHPARPSAAGTPSVPAGPTATPTTAPPSSPPPTTGPSSSPSPAPSGSPSASASPAPSATSGTSRSA